MRKLKVYLDTSVISHLFADDAPEKMRETNIFWSDLEAGKYNAFISPVVTDEIGKCSQPKRDRMLDMLRQVEIEVLTETAEINELAKAYIAGGVLNEKSHEDCLHIAFAVANDCDIIVSWNFKHLANFKTVNKVKVINSINNYREISIIPPSMLLDATN